MKPLNLAIVGATGMVGSAMLSVLADRQFPVNRIYPIASKQSAGGLVEFAGKDLTVLDIENFDFSQVDIALFSAGTAVARQYAPQAAKANCFVIDNSSCFRYQDDIPLIIPEVNPQALNQVESQRIIANPNCSTIQMLVAVKPIADLAGIARINVATYQAVSGTGRSATQELAQQTTALLSSQSVKCEIYPKQIAFNVIPHIDEFQENGYTREEMKMVWETKKILGDQAIQVNPTAVRVPVFYGHSEAIHLETKKDFSLDDIKQVLAKAPGVKLMTEQEYPTPIDDASNDLVTVGRVRKDLSHPRGLNLWVVADNVRKGAALNAVQIAEMLLERNFQ